MSELECIDAGRALDLLCEAVHRHGGRTVGAVHGGIVAAALCCAGLADSELGCVRQYELRTLWVRGQLPLPMTLGAVAVLNRAQSAQRAGLTWSLAVDHAARSAELLCGLLPLRPCVGSAVSAP